MRKGAFLLPTVENKTQTEEQQEALGKKIFGTRRVKGIVKQINNLLGQSHLTMYGTDRVSEIDQLDTEFYNTMNRELGKYTNSMIGDTTSFISKLYSQDRADKLSSERFTDTMNGMAGGFGSSDASINAMNGFLEVVYRNRLMEQSDLHQVSHQLIELQEAISITRDAIISPDTVEGRMNRILKFEGVQDEQDDDYVPIVEQVEKKYELLEKIKNFIVPYTLEYGTYYVYVIPYAKLFSDIVRNRRSIINGQGGIRTIGESVSLFESVVGDESRRKSKKPSKNEETYMDQLFTTYMESADPDYDPQRAKTDRGYAKTFENTKKEFSSDVKAILERVEICNDPNMAIPFLEEGKESFAHYAEAFMTEAKNNRDFETVNLRNPKSKNKKLTPFDVIQKTGSVEGAYTSNGKNLDDSNFDQIKDVYIRMIEPTKIIPVEIIDERIGYYLVYAEEATRLNGLVSSQLDTRGVYGGYGTGTTFIDEICEKIVKSFNKPFLEENMKFKRLIVQAVNYYNLNVNRIKFQFVPAEYIQEFMIDKDEDGHGQSMVKKSLFYAKMYLMLLMFKILSIVLYSNDTRVNYVKQSGLRKDVANKVQEIIRRKQSRQINMYDLYNYSTLINKIGAGTEMYVPTGRSGERPIETEILSGQEIQLNTELLEMLKNAYILGTGVPAAIVNYLNEAEFAKVIEQNNSKFNARVVNYQLDFNPSVTEFYKKILRWSTNIPEEKIEKFIWTLQPPKSTTQSIKSEMISQFQQMSEMLIKLFMGDQYDPANKDNANLVREFTLMLAEEQLPMLNIPHLRELFEEAKLNATEAKLKPNPANNDDDTNIDLGDFGKEFQ